MNTALFAIAIIAILVCLCFTVLPIPNYPKWSRVWALTLIFTILSKYLLDDYWWIWGMVLGFSASKWIVNVTYSEHKPAPAKQTPKMPLGPPPEQIP